MYLGHLKVMNRSLSRLAEAMRTRWEKEDGKAHQNIINLIITTRWVPLSNTILSQCHHHMC